MAIKHTMSDTLVQSILTIGAKEVISNLIRLHFFVHQTHTLLQ